MCNLIVSVIFHNEHQSQLLSLLSNPWTFYRY